MNAHDYRFLLADRATLERMLSEADPDSVIRRMSLERRKRDVEKGIAAFEAAPTRLVEAQVAFRGGPVASDGRIASGFAGEALGAFTDAVATVGADQGRDLSPYGRLPNRASYEMAVRNVSSGSFAFQVEREFPHGAPPEEPAALEYAIEQFKSIMEASKDTDEALSEATEGTSERAVRSVHKFLKTMEKRDAYCSLRSKSGEFQFKSAAEVRRSAARVDPRNIKDSEREMTVRFRGALPEARRVEFVIEGEQRTMSGKVGQSVKDAAAINDFLNAPALVNVRVRQVGASNPDYTITRWEPAKRSP